MQVGELVTWCEGGWLARAGRVLACKDYRGATYVLVAPLGGSIREKWMSAACVESKTAALAAAS